MADGSKRGTREGGFGALMRDSLHDQDIHRFERVGPTGRGLRRMHAERKALGRRMEHLLTNRATTTVADESAGGMAKPLNKAMTGWSAVSKPTSGQEKCPAASPPQPGVPMTDASSHVPAAEDALEFLSDDQDAILELFDRYDSLVTDNAEADERRELAEEICSMVAVHVEIKREILYPAAREALSDETPVDEAIESHDALDATIEDIQSGDATEPRYNTGVRVLQELFVEAVEAERSGLFPLLRSSSIDLEELGGELGARAEMLLGGAEDDAD